MILKEIKSRYGIAPFYLFIAAVLCLLYALAFQPISWQAQGDSGNYITLAKRFLGVDNTGIDLSNRSPFSSMVLAIFIKIFGQDNFLQWVMYFQYLLIFLCGVLVFKIFDRIFENRYIPALIGLIFLFNLSTITYGFMILTETLALFLFLCITFTIVRYISTQRKKLILLISGILSGLLILTRFNTLLIPLCIIFCIFFAHFIEFRWKKIGTLSIHIFTFLIPLLIILNTWCYKNYRESGFYFLFPAGYGSQRFLEPAMVDENTHVSPENREVLRIFLQAKEKILSREPGIKKGSLLEFVPIQKLLIEINAGWRIYVEARPELLTHFQLETAANPEFLLGEKLRGFFREVAGQNKFKLFLLRIYSLVNGFRASASTLPGSESLNLNILPSPVFIFYKIAFFLMVLAFFILTVFYLVFILKKGQITGNYIQISMIVLIFYFPLINFLAATIADANRFKYPSEPLMLGMFVYYIYYFLRSRRKNKNV